MHDITLLSNRTLGIHYESKHKELNNIQTAIVDDITDLLGIVPVIDDSTYTNPEKFYHYCKPYLAYIEKGKEELLITLIQQNKDIKEEIKKRQLAMLKEIGITTPSTRVMMIVEQTGGNNFPAFDTMIKYVKTAKKYKKRKRPKRRVIYAPKELIETFKKI